MASGTIFGTTPNQYITAKIEWSSTANILANTSSVTATLYYKKSASSSAATYGTGTFAVNINGSSNSRTFRITLNPNDAWVQAVSHTVTVSHNADGTKSISISASGGITGLSFNSTSCAGTAILDKNPRASTPTWTGTPTIGTAFTISLNPADATFKHTLTYSWGSTSGTIASNVGASTSFTAPMSFCNGVPNGTQGTLFVTAETFTSDGVSLGKVTRSGALSVPAAVVPTISAITITDTGGDVPAAWGVYVKGKSTIHVNVTAAGAYGSTVTAYSISAGGNTVSSNDSDVLRVVTSGSVTVSVTVTDSRGRTAASTQTVTVEDYAEPTIGAFALVRANAQGQEVDNGTYAKITLRAAGSAVGNKNTVTAKIYHMRSDAQSWTLARTISVAYSIDQTVMISNMVSSRSYSYKVEVEDEFATTAGHGTLNAEGAVIGWLNGGIGISFGRTAEEQYTLDSAWKIHGREGAQFDAPVNATDYKIDNESLLRVVDIAQLSLAGTNQRLNATESYVTIRFSSRYVNLTNKLTLDSYGIKIPAGVRYVTISAQVCFGAATAGARYVSAAIGATANTVARSQKFHASTSVAETHVISGALTPVSEGDIIILAAYGNTADTIYGIYNQTYLTVTAYA